MSVHTAAGAFTIVNILKMSQFGVTLVCKIFWSTTFIPKSSYTPIFRTSLFDMPANTSPGTFRWWSQLVVFHANSKAINKYM